MSDAHDKGPTIVHRPSKIVSGGQTGVDRAALDAAIAIGIPHGGWCPRGRLAEDGAVPAKYAMQEMRSPSYAARTEQNVIDSDATLIFYRNLLQGGTALTHDLALQHKRPVFLIDLARLPDTPFRSSERLEQLPVVLQELIAWLEEGRFLVLNVAGPRESQQPGIGDEARDLLTWLFH